jgi:hypothetical protein
MSTAFDHAQAAYDAAEPDWSADDPFNPASITLEGILEVLDEAGQLDDSQEVHALSDRQATVGIWIDGHEYSLTLMRED